MSTGARKFRFLFGKLLVHFCNFKHELLQIVEALCDISLTLSLIGHIVEDIKVLLHLITEGKIIHTRCQTNSVAHRLAKIGLSVQQDYRMVFPQVLPLNVMP